MAESPAFPPSSSAYWYDTSDPAVVLLAALRRFRSADHEMRRRLSAGMAMSATDLMALQHVIAHQLAEDPATPRTVAEHLHISTASTTKLLDRLTASGHLERAPHPRDRRSVILLATDHAHEQVRERLTRMHDRMLEIAREVPEEARDAAASFLLAMARHLDEEAMPDPLSPRDEDQLPGATRPVS